MPSAVTLRMLPLPSVSAIWALASELPVTVTPLASSEALTASSPATALMVVVGATVSTEIDRVPAALTLPATSVAVALRVSAPWPMAPMSVGVRV